MLRSQDNRYFHQTTLFIGIFAVLMSGVFLPLGVLLGFAAYAHHRNHKAGQRRRREEALFHAWVKAEAAADAAALRVARRS